MICIFIHLLKLFEYKETYNAENVLHLDLGGGYGYACVCARMRAQFIF